MCHILGMFNASKRLRAAEDSIATLERRVKDIEDGMRLHILELEEMFEKLNRLYGRIKKRQTRATQAEPENEVAESPCHDETTRKVLAFREAKSHVLG